jgi:hypothetical protein
VNGSCRCFVDRICDHCQVDVNNVKLSKDLKLLNYYLLSKFLVLLSTSLVVLHVKFMVSASILLESVRMAVVFVVETIFVPIAKHLSEITLMQVCSHSVFTQLIQILLYSISQNTHPNSLHLLRRLPILSSTRLLSRRKLFFFSSQKLYFWRGRL